MAFLTKEQILAAADLKREAMDAPEWGGQVLVRSWTGRERDEFEGAIMTAKQGGKMEMANIRAKAAALSICDENNALLFTEKDIEALGKKSAAPLDRVFAVVQKLNLISDKDAQVLEKN